MANTMNAVTISTDKLVEQINKELSRIHNTGNQAEQSLTAMLFMQYQERRNSNGEHNRREALALLSKLLTIG